MVKGKKQEKKQDEEKEEQTDDDKNPTYGNIPPHIPDVAPCDPPEPSSDELWAKGKLDLDFWLRHEMMLGTIQIRELWTKLDALKEKCK